MSSKKVCCCQARSKGSGKETGCQARREVCVQACCKACSEGGKTRSQADETVQTGTEGRNKEACCQTGCEGQACCKTRSKTCRKASSEAECKVCREAGGQACCKARCKTCSEACRETRCEAGG